MQNKNTLFIISVENCVCAYYQYKKCRLGNKLNVL